MSTPQQVIDNDVHHDIDMHADFLTEVAKGDILEIGVRTGISTAAFLRGVQKNGGHVYSVDNNPDCSKVFQGLSEWTFILADSKDTAQVKAAIPASLDILFIDGDHTYEGVKADLANYAPLVKSGGRIILHDVVSAYDPGVRQAFDEFIDATKYEAEIFPSWVGLGQVLIP
jgi:predicted O-methyltransferase YrrM